MFGRPPGLTGQTPPCPTPRSSGWFGLMVAPPPRSAARFPPRGGDAGGPAKPDPRRPRFELAQVSDTHGTTLRRKTALCRGIAQMSGSAGARHRAVETASAPFGV